MGIVKHKEDLMVKRATDGTFESKQILDDEEQQEEKESRDKISVSLDQVSRARLEEIKAAWDIKSDSKALKLALEIGRNAIFALLSAETIRKLSDRTRVRASDYGKNGELKK